MISEKIEKANIEAMRQKDTISRGIFSVVLNKIKLEKINLRARGEEITDAGVIQILQKTLKELSEEKENYLKVGNKAEAENIEKQIKVTESFLPAMMSEEEIIKIIKTLEDKSVGNVMKHFKANYAGKCDMRTVQSALGKI